MQIASLAAGANSSSKCQHKTWKPERFAILQWIILFGSRLQSPTCHTHTPCTL